ncbi:MAG: hypothetical protein WDW38_000328 [Sanguina aurantia]
MEGLGKGFFNEEEFQALLQQQLAPAPELQQQEPKHQRAAAVGAQAPESGSAAVGAHAPESGSSGSPSTRAAVQQ